MSPDFQIWWNYNNLQIQGDQRTLNIIENYTKTHHNKIAWSSNKKILKAPKRHLTY